MTNNALGARGEALFITLITEFHAFGTEYHPLFAPAYLGEKWETVDFIVELERASGIQPFFFVQVNSTRRGYSADNMRLNIKVKREDVRRLSLYAVPTYIVGINDVDMKGYIVSANGEAKQSLSTMSIAHRIDATSRQALWNEVLAFWKQPTLPKLVSTFVNSKWK